MRVGISADLSRLPRDCGTWKEPAISKHLHDDSGPSRDGASGGLRVGHGYDAHRFVDGAEVAGRVLVLGGVAFPGEPSLAGHSDADVVAHAVIDALLGAAGLGDIGTMFCDSDERWRDADSLEMLASAAERMARARWRLVNADCTVVCDRPKIAPQRDMMQAHLSEAAGGPVTVCGKRTEGLTSAEGIVAHAVALVARSEPQ